MVKSNWEALLRAEPTLTPLGAPDTLVYLMDDTMAQLWSALHSESLDRGPKRTNSLASSNWGRCKCGLNPLLYYFHTGVKTLLLMTNMVANELTEFSQTEHATLREELLSTFETIAQHEMNLFCEICQHKRLHRVPGKQPPGRKKSTDIRNWCGPCRICGRKQSPAVKKPGATAPDSPLEIRR